MRRILRASIETAAFADGRVCFLQEKHPPKISSKRPGKTAPRLLLPSANKPPHSKGLTSVSETGRGNHAPCLMRRDVRRLRRHVRQRRLSPAATERDNKIDHLSLK